MKPSRFALISVTDKTGVIAFAKGLIQLGFRLLSTGGTAALLRDNGLSVTDVAEFTGHPECLDGRVKTLHPKVYGGVLADRSKASHLSDMKRLGFEAVDLVAVNLYDFAGNARGMRKPLSQVIEHIDIGGPTMLRAAAKNNDHVYVIVDPNDYSRVLEDLSGSRPQEGLRVELAAKVFQTTAAYDQMIAAEFEEQISLESGNLKLSSVGRPMPTHLELSLSLMQDLRYGENSHQKASFYAPQPSVAEPGTGTGKNSGLAAAQIIQGKELSYNNIVDLDAAAAIVADFDPRAALTIIKHTNPCGTAVDPRLPPPPGQRTTDPTSSFTVEDLFRKALACDPKCAFGGIVAANKPVDGSAADAMASIFLECVIAPDFTSEALRIFAAKKNLRLIRSDVTLKRGRSDALAIRSVEGGFLVQTPDNEEMDPSRWICASQTKPLPETLAELYFAMTLARHVKSNAIVVTREHQSIGIGAGQMSRIDAARISVEKAKELGHSTCGAVAASDAFFPFRDSIDILAKAGITAIVQPGGSIKDQESIDAANEHGIVLMMTGVRHFKH
ncbi:MAG: bifunctional phosphoribosylaminoimidazolecarboxamide formyltransferase/IMP cyclohydrolase [Proteobacteria bacterium]|nr:bifunctional phosphoribosylaminoimidazolecarboxamide formyltransferase/IMP cyclohydrolase [Pseudomonadota bacterium]